MQDNITIARPYASAVFEQAQDEGNLEQWSLLLDNLSTIVRDPQMRMILSNPNVSDAQLLELVNDVLDEQLSTTATNFIKVLIQSNRLGFVPNISALYEDKRAEAEGRMDVNVISAYELEQGQQAQIAEAMGKKLGKKISIKPQLDNHLIGGMIIRAGDSVIDASIRGRLTELQNTLIG